MRLDKFLSLLAVCSRSESKALVRSGRLTVDGVAAKTPAQAIDPEKNDIRLDGEKLLYRPFLHLMMNKPSGLLTAARDSRQPTVMDLLPPSAVTQGCMPVGRLDKDTEGLLLFTTDGQLGHRLLSPKKGVQKVYRAQVDGPLTQEHVEAFSKGLELSDFTALPAKLEIAEDDPCVGFVTVQEGKFHQVKRMFAACGRQVLFLKRLSFGTIPLDESLAPGEYRELTEEETRILYAISGGEVSHG